MKRYKEKEQWKWGEFNKDFQVQIFPSLKEPSFLGLIQRILDEAGGILLDHP